MPPSTLRDRLRGIIRPGESTSVAAPAGLARHAFDHVLGGAWCETAGGRSFVVRRRLAPEDRYGAFRIDDFARGLQLGESTAPLLGAGAARAPFLFFDLETTGLSGGAGTHAFLVGCGWFDPAGGFVTEQHLLTRYDVERPMLQTIAHALAQTGALVTFNGKSFDAPVIETRYLFHRLESPCAQLPHVDLLHPARRFWGGSGGAGCSLVALEGQVLGVRRTADVPGVEIPARYFQFVRSGDARPLVGVFEHNRLDLLSLAGLTARLCHLIDRGPWAVREAREALALGHMYERAGLDDRAEESFERALALSGPTQTDARRLPPAGDARSTATRIDALRALALRARRRRRYEVAAECWRQILEVNGCPSPIAREAIEALAVHHEHRARDLAAAKIFALRSLEFGERSAWGDAARHRLARIERKLVSEREPLFPSSPSQPSCDSLTSARRTSS